MPAKILHAAKHEGGYQVLVHLDTAMTVGAHEAHDLQLAEGSPHPHFVRQYTWPNRTAGVHQKGDPSVPYDPKDPNSQPTLIDLTDEEYEAMILDMARQFAAQDVQGIRFYQPVPKPFIIVDALHGKEL